MDKMSETGESSENMTSPVLLNSLDFPALTVPQRPDTLIPASYSRPSMTNTVSQRVQSKKRHVKEDDEQAYDDDNLSASQNSWSTESLSSPATSPVKKSRKLAYRDPPPVLQSLDSDAFRTIFQTPVLSDSQNSESELWSPSWINHRASINNSLSENLGSLGDIIQKYSVATLNSIRGFEITDNSLTSSHVVSSESTQIESTNIIREDPVLNIAVNSNTAKLSLNAVSPILSSETMVPEEAVKEKSNLELGQSNLMSIASDTIFVNQSSSLCMSVSDQSTKPVSFEKLMSVSSEHDTLKFSENKTIIKASCSKSIAVESNPVTDDQHHDDYEDNSGDSGKGEDVEDEESKPSLFEFPETDLKSYRRCKKSKNHRKFYSVPDLQVNDLPDEIRHEDSVTFLSCLSQLVVQITVHSTSHARGSDDMYSDYIGTNKKRNGSGFIASVDDSIRKFVCKRANCSHAIPIEDFSSSFEDSGTMTPPLLNRNSSSGNTSLNRSISSTSNASSKFDRSISNMSTASSSSTSSSGGQGLKHFFYGGVFIRTNRHVIFDKSEADNAYVKFFYNTPQGKEVVHGHVTSIAGINNNQDNVTLHVMSHDRSLFTTIGLCTHNAKLSYKQMLQNTDRIEQIHSCKHKHSWVAIIAHPHGMSKTITFGRVMKETAERDRVIKYYDAATCPGSSGGLVITPSLLRLQWPGAVHSCFDKNTGYNVTFDSRCQDMDASDIGRINKSVLSRKQSYPDDFFKL